MSDQQTTGGIVDLTGLTVGGANPMAVPGSQVIPVTLNPGGVFSTGGYNITAAPLGPGPDAEQQVQPFRMLMALIGTATSDGRIFDDVTWRDLPLNVLWQHANLPGHEGSVVVGWLEHIVRDGDEVWGYGWLDNVGADGREAIRLVRDVNLRGVSVDAAALEVNEGEDGLLHFVAEIGAVTIVAFPAFRETQIELVDHVQVDAAADLASDEDAAMPDDMDPKKKKRKGMPRMDSVASEFHGVGLLASATPSAMPAAWFRAPETDHREPLHVEADGRVWGHIYGWGECHTGSPHGQCIQAPPSRTNYAYFRTGAVLTDEGEIATGPIVLSADHADLKAPWLAAKDHYAHSGLAVADVAVGEDSHGIWVAGCVRPGTSDELVHAMRASAPSGDWRPVGGGLELVAVLSVNTPGFPALAASFQDGALTALVASGGLVEPSCGCGGEAASADLQARLEALAADYAALRVLTAPARAALLDEWDREHQEASASRAAAIEADVIG